MAKRKMWLLSVAVAAVSVGAFVGAQFMKKDVNVSVNAESSNFKYVQNFASNVLPDTWEVNASNGGAPVSVADGALTVNNASGATEINLQDVSVTNFVLKFDATFASGDGSFSVKYGVPDDGNGGYELKVGMGVTDESLRSYYGDHDTQAQGNNGKAIEFRSINEVDLASGVNDRTLLAFNYLEVFEKNTLYHFEINVCKDAVQLYVNDTLTLNQKHTGEFGGDDLILRVDGKLNVSFDNIEIYGLLAYGEKLCSALTYGESLTVDEALALEKQVGRVEDYLQRFLPEEDVKDFDSYLCYEGAKALINDALKPTLSVNWTLGSTGKAGTEITLPNGSATGYNGTSVYVKKQIRFVGKYLQIKDNRASLNEVGVYEVIYTATDVNGHQAQTVYTITVE